jgi:hypothetical protein
MAVPAYAGMGLVATSAPEAARARASNGAVSRLSAVRAMVSSFGFYVWPPPGG